MAARRDICGAKGAFSVSLNHSPWVTLSSPKLCSGLTFQGQAEPCFFVFFCGCHPKKIQTVDCAMVLKDNMGHADGVGVNTLPLTQTQESQLPGQTAAGTRVSWTVTASSEAILHLTSRSDPAVYQLCTSCLVFSLRLGCLWDTLGLVFCSPSHPLTCILLLWVSIPLTSACPADASHWPSQALKVNLSSHISSSACV